MDDKFVVGNVQNPYQENRIELVVGLEFHDCPGFFQFYAINSNGHFRKRPDKFDDVWPVSRGVFRSLKGDWDAVS